MAGGAGGGGGRRIHARVSELHDTEMAMLVPKKGSGGSALCFRVLLSLPRSAPFFLSLSRVALLVCVCVCGIIDATLLKHCFALVALSRLLPNHPCGAMPIDHPRVCSSLSCACPSSSHSVHCLLPSHAFAATSDLRRSDLLRHGMGVQVNLLCLVGFCCLVRLDVHDILPLCIVLQV